MKKGRKEGRKQAWLMLENNKPKLSITGGDEYPVLLLETKEKCTILAEMILQPLALYQNNCTEKLRKFILFREKKRMPPENL